MPVVLSGVLVAQDGRRPSGPAVGSAMPSLEIFESGKGERDLRAEIGNKPAALLFVQILDRNAAPLIRGIDTIHRERALTGFIGRSILIEADRSSAERRLTAVNGSLRMRAPMVLSIDGAEGPGSYALDKSCSLTLVLVKDGKVQRSTGFVDPGRQDIDLLRTWIAELDGPLPTTVAEWDRRLGDSLPKDGVVLRQRLIAAMLEREALRKQIEKLQNDLRRAQNQNRRGMNRQNRPQAARRPDMRAGERARMGRDATEAPARQREGAPPTDADLLRMFRSFLRKTNDAAECDALYGQILLHSATGAGLEKQTKEMFRLMLSLDYGAPRARVLAESYVAGKRPPSRGKR